MIVQYFNNDYVSFSISLICFLFILTLTIIDIKSSSSQGYSQIIFTIGILGTFVGIAWGLWNFNTDKIVKSIPVLLGGLKSSFFSSIFGMISVVVISLKKKIGNKSQYDNSIDETLQGILINTNKISEKFDNILKNGMEQVIKSIKEGNNSNLKMIEFQEKYYQKLEKSTDGINNLSEKFDIFLKDGILEIIKPIKVGNEEIRNGFNKTELALGDISHNIAEGASKAVVAALESTMKEFNENLKENFGENFHQLNEACLKMIKWQEEYKNLIDQAIENLNSINHTLGTASKTHEKIIEDSKDFINVSQNLEKSIQLNFNQIQTMNKLLGEYGKLSEGAKKLFPNLEKGFGDINEKLNEFCDKISGNLNNQHTAVQNIINGIKEGLPASLEILNANLTEVTKQFTETYRTFIANLPQQE